MTPPARPLLRPGTCSWSAPSWVGSFYPTGTRQADFLSFYATRFSTVEADVTYYRIPDAALVRGWERRTPEGFVLCAKFPRSIVHAGDGPRPDPSKLLHATDANGLTPAMYAEAQGREDVARLIEATAIDGAVFE